MIRTIPLAALITALAACTPATNTEVAAAPADAPPIAPATDLAAPTPDTTPAAANTTDTLSSTPPAAPAAAQPPAPSVSPAPAPQTQAGASKAELDAGAGVYARTCAMCHGPKGEGTQMGAALKLRDAAAIKDKVIKGATKPDEKMPPMGSMLPAADIDAVAKFVAAGMPQ